MHASGANTTSGVDDAVASAVFPAGWSAKQASYNTFTIFPLMDDDGNCYYNGGCCDALAGRRFFHLHPK